MLRTLTKLGLIAVIAFFTSKLVNLVVYAAERELPAPKPDDASTLSPALAALAAEDAAQRILDRNLMQARVSEPIETEEPCSVAAHVIGVVAGNKSEWSYVLYRDPRTQETEIYSPRAGRDQLPGRVTLLAVEDGSVRLRVRDHIEVCSVGGGRPPLQDREPLRKLSEREWAVQREELARHVSSIQGDVRVVPSFHGGDAQGFKLFAIRPGSIVERSGLMNGDVITAVNGVALTTPAALLKTYEQLQTINDFTLQIERRGTVIEQVYRLE